MQPTFEIAVTLKGSNLQEVLAQAQSLIDAEGGTTTPTAPKSTKGRTAKEALTTIAESSEEELLAATDEAGTDETTTDELGSFDEVTPEEPKAPKAKKVTDKDVNTAAMAHAKKFGRPKTMEILTKKFKVKSILELKPDQYTAVIAALKV